MKGIIIGGGIGGLTTAIALKKFGIDVGVFEQVGKISEVGAGVWMAANALNVMERIGIIDKIFAAGKELEQIVVKDVGEKEISRVVMADIKKKFKYGTVAIHRADLQKLLLDCLPHENVHEGKKFASYKKNGNRAEAHFTDGSMAEADFIICADGIHSKGRTQMNGENELRYSGQTCWRFLCPNIMPAGESGMMYEIWGNQKGLRAAYSSISQDEIYCYITTCTERGGKDDKQKLISFLLNLCKDFPPIIKKIISSADPQKILRNDLIDFAPVNNWCDGNVVLMGDAAHATTPNLGQGACQAVEDAYVLAKCLSENENAEEAFHAYQNIRMQKAHYITNTSWKLGKLSNYGGIMKKLIKGVYRMTPKSFEEKQFDKIYGVNY